MQPCGNSPLLKSPILWALGTTGLSKRLGMLQSLCSMQQKDFRQSVVKGEAKAVQEEAPAASTPTNDDDDIPF